MGSAGRESKSSYRAVPERKARAVTGMAKVGLWQLFSLPDTANVPVAC